MTSSYKNKNFNLLAMMVLVTSVACKKDSSLMVLKEVHGTRANTSSAAGSTDSNGETTATLSADASGNQILSASSSSEISGASAIFPPGSIAVATSVTIAPGSSLVTGSSLPSELGSTGLAVSSSATAVVVASAGSADPASPFTISLPVPVVSLMLAPNLQTLSVVYKVYSYTDKKYYVGVLPRSALTYVDGKLVVSAPRFGSYQAVYLSAEATAKLEAVSATAFTKKSEVKTTTTTTTTTTADTTAPVAGAVTVPVVGVLSMRVGWTAASDQVTAASALHYSLYVSSSNNISTVALAEANGQIPTGCSGTALLACDVTGRSPATTYHAAVVVRDAAGNKGISATTSQQTRTLHTGYEGSDGTDTWIATKQLGSSGWSTETQIAAGTANYNDSYAFDMEVDGNGRPLFVFTTQSTKNELRRTAHSGGAFGTAAIENTSNWAQVALDVGTNGVPIYAGGNPDTLKMEIHDEVTSGAFTAESTGYGFGTAPIDVAVTANGKRYGVSSNGSNLQFVTNESGSWAITSVPYTSSFTAFGNAALAVDSNNIVHVVWTASYSVTNKILYNAYEPGVGWVFSTATAKVIEALIGINFNWVAIAVDSLNVPHVVYSYQDPGIPQYKIKLSKFDGTNWSAASDVATPGQLATSNRNVSVDFDAMDTPYVSYYDFFDASLYYTYWNGASWLTPEIVQTPGGGYAGQHTVIRVGQPY